MTDKFETGRIAAEEIFDWDYLVEIGTYLQQDEIKDLDRAVRAFAYAFTSTASADTRDRMLAEWIQKATHLQSKETNEKILAALAERMHGDLGLIREFAKQHGVRLRRS